jgi:hypothetical protein
MAAPLGFKDFTTGEVLTAADVDGYLMQGIWVFASAAARDAAVTSPQEGNFAFLKDTNVTTYYTGSAWANLDTTGMVNPMTTTGDTIYSSSGSTPARLGIGTTGQVLTVAGGIPSWATPASSGGMTLLATSTLTGASVTVSSISQDYKHLLVLLKGVYTSAGENMCFRLNGDSGSLYSWGQIRNVGTTVSGATTENGTSVIFSNGTISAATPVSRLGSATIWLYRYTDTDQQEFDAYSYADSASLGSFNSHGNYNKSAAITSITYLPLSGNWSGGTAYLYGVS